MNLQQILRELDGLMPDFPFARHGGSFLLMAGLPGSGKSLIVEKLQVRLACAVISTDRVRLSLRPRPTYTAAETILVYELCYHLVDRRLARGQRVIFDGTNHLAQRRQQFLSLVEQRRAPAAVCQVVAMPEIVRRRLAARNSGRRRKGDLSQADWAVYLGMAAAQEPITGPYLTLDSSCTPPEDLAEQVRAYWLGQEASERVNESVANSHY
jgi:predicted kinase